MANGHDYDRGYPRNEVPHPPSYQPPVVVVPERRSLLGCLQWGCLTLLAAGLVIFLAPYVAALFYFLWQWVHSSPKVAETPRFVKEFLPLWILAIVAGIVVGAIIRLVRRI